MCVCALVAVVGAPGAEGPCAEAEAACSELWRGDRMCGKWVPTGRTNHTRPSDETNGKTKRTERNVMLGKHETNQKAKKSNRHVSCCVAPRPKEGNWEFWARANVEEGLYQNYEMASENEFDAREP